MARPADRLGAFRHLSRAELEAVVEAGRARRSLAHFIRGAWHVHHARKPLIWNWHIDAIAEHLQAVTAGQIQRLVICIPPGFMKSLIVSVYWPAWEWASDPTLEYICASVAPAVALRDARRCHEVVDSAWYQRTFAPDWAWSRDQDAKGYYLNTMQGGRRSISTGQAIIGFRGHRLIWDDILAPEQAYSDKAGLHLATDWLSGSFLDRTHDEDTPIVGVMQRLHDADPAGWAIREDWDHLILPNEYDGPRTLTSIGWEDPRQEQGELLFPGRQSAEKTAELKKNPLDYARKQMQRPAPPGGSIVKLDQLCWYTSIEELPEFDYLFASVDPKGYKKRKHKRGSETRRDPVAIGVFGVSGSKKYLLELQRGKWAPDEVIERIKALIKARPKIRFVIIEEKGTGKDICDALESQIHQIRRYNPQDQSKQQRLWAIVPDVARGDLWLPGQELTGVMAWRDGYVRELTTFPASEHDDQVDLTTQGFLYLRRHVGKTFVKRLG